MWSQGIKGKKLGASDTDPLGPPMIFFVMRDNKFLSAEATLVWVSISHS